jgi:phosphatidylinositol-3,4,5-trisphosphate 3-phosphatase and dual-specificity protein phosphatase PTEN
MDYIRSIVSGNKNRYLERGFNLDLTYITPKIIAMSLPGEGLHKFYRNPIESVSKFLNEQHAGKYKVFNLSGLKYDYEKFDNRVVEYPWEDHYPPQIHILFSACKVIHEWLLADNQNIIAVNCKAGKGRTGTLICCYLLFCGRLQSTEDALKYYKAKRFSRGGGVTQPSQIRYIYYFLDILIGKVKGSLIYDIVRVQVRTAPHISSNSSKLILKIKNEDKVIFSNKKTHRDKQVNFQDNWEDSILHELALMNSHLRVQGDLTCFINHWGFLKEKKICRFSFNTAFVPRTGELMFKKDEIDPDNFKNDKRVSDSFFVFIVFQPLCKCTNDIDISLRCSFCKQNLSFEEVQKWNSIKNIILEKLDMNPKVILFGHPDLDDIDEILANTVAESELSSDGSAS